MIRNGKKEDADKIARIKIDKWRKTYLNIFTDELLEGLEVNNEKNKFLKNLEEKNVIVYEKQNAVIAYCYYCFSGCRAWTESYIRENINVNKERDVRCGIINAYVGA